MHLFTYLMILTFVTACGPDANITNTDRKALTFPAARAPERLSQETTVTKEAMETKSAPLSEPAMEKAIETAAISGDTQAITESMGVENQTAIAEQAEESVPQTITMEEIHGYTYNHFMDKTNNQERADQGTQMLMELIESAKGANPFKMSKSAKKMRDYAKVTNESKGDVFEVVKTVTGICAVIAGTMSANPYAVALGVVLIL